MLKSNVFLALTCTGVLLLLYLVLSSLYLLPTGRQAVLDEQKELVLHLGLTDFAIWTEARYTRHPSQTDFFSPFQDFPSSFEHFPAGSIIAPVYTAERDSK